MYHQNVQRWQRTGYITAKWSDLLSKQEVLATVKDITGKPVTLPLGSKLMMASVITFDENSKIASELVQQIHLKLEEDDENKARFFIGLSNSHEDTKGVAFDLIKPVGIQAPMNNRNDHAFMRPSLTAAEGRNFGDIATPLFVDCWQLDAVGIRPDPVDNIRKDAYMNVLFYKFDKQSAQDGTGDISLHGDASGASKGLVDLKHTSKYFNGELKLKMHYEYVTMSRPVDVKTGWGEISVKV